MCFRDDVPPFATRAVTLKSATSCLLSHSTSPSVKESAVKGNEDKFFLYKEDPFLEGKQTNVDRVATHESVEMCLV